MKTDDQKFEGPGFETFRSNFSLISQKCDKRHTRCAFTKLLKLIYQLSKKTIRSLCRFPRQGFQGGPQRVDRVAVWFLAASPELWHKKCYAGLQPVDVLLSCRNHQRGEKIFVSFILLVQCPYKFWKNICSFIACTLIQPYSYHGWSSQQYVNRLKQYFLANAFLQ